MDITALWLDKEWEMQNTIFEFIRFKSSHVGKAGFSILNEVISSWGLELEKVQSITTDNASAIMKGFELLRKQLFATNQFQQYSSDFNFHVRFIAHVLNLVVKECMVWCTLRLRRWGSY